MRYRPLGKTGINVSEVSFGCGPVPALFTATDWIEQQVRTIGRAVELGINWFDTAATYGAGKSEENLGHAIQELGLQVSGSVPSDRNTIHIATKVRLFPEDLADIRGAVNRSVDGSLQRLRTSRVALLQLHNSITAERGAQHTSITPDDVLNGVLPAFEDLRRAGTVRHIGLTGLGERVPLMEVIRSGQFATVQAPYNLLHSSAGCDGPSLPDYPPEHDLRGLFAACRQSGVGVFAIRVFAGGALAGNPPSKHTLTTKFFPLELYQRDLEAAEAQRATLRPGLTLPEVALRGVLGHPAVSSAIIGFAKPEEVEEAVSFAERGPISFDETQE